jgi:hypothetical protein
MAKHQQLVVLVQALVAFEQAMIGILSDPDVLDEFTLNPPLVDALSGIRRICDSIEAAGTASGTRPQTPWLPKALQ